MYTEEHEYKFDAFISYCHCDPDKQIAAQLQKLLENFTPPKEINQSGKKLHIFRDETELPTSDSLSDLIRNALISSRYLIVICSRASEASHWCMEEIEYFKSIHGGRNEHILTLLCNPDGTVSFPDALRFETVTVTDAYGTHTVTREVEPLAANVSAPTLSLSLKKLKTEYLRIAASLFGCSFDALYQREQKQKNKRRLTILLIAAAVMAVISIISISSLITISSQKTQIENDYRDLKISEANNLAMESEQLELNGDLIGALNAAVQSLELHDQTVPIQNKAVEQAAKLSGAYQEELFTAVRQINQKNTVSDFVLLDGGKRLLTTDYSKGYLWDTESGELIKTVGGKWTDLMLYKDNSLGSGEFVEITPGSVEGVKKGELILLTDYIFVPDGKTYSDNMVCYTDNQDSSVCRLDPNDGGKAWEYAYKEDGTLSLNSFSKEGVVVKKSDNLYVHAPSDGSVIASIEKDVLKKYIGDEVVYNTYYANGYLALYYQDINNINIYMFKHNGNAFDYAWSKQLKRNDLEYNYKFSICDDSVYFISVNSETTYSKTVFKCFDLKNGNELWSVTGSKLTGGDAFVDKIPKDKSGFDYDLAVAIVGNHFILVNAEKGTIISEQVLPDSAKEMRISTEGDFVFFTDTDGLEICVSIEALIQNKTDIAFFINHDFRTTLSSACCCNGEYAVISKNKSSVTLYHTVKNNNATRLLTDKNGDSDRLFYSYMLSPDKTRAVVEQTYPEDAFLIIDAKSNEIESSIPYSDVGFAESSFLNEDLLTVKNYSILKVYEAKSGSLINEYKNDDYNIDKTVINQSTGKIYLLSKDYKLYESDGLSEPELVFDAEKEGYHSIEQIDVSKDGKSIFLRLYDKNVKNELIVISTDEDITTKFETESDKTYMVGAFWWSPDNKTIVLLYLDGTAACFDCVTGEQIEKLEYDYNIVDLVDVEGSLCVLDIEGNFVKFSDVNGSFEKTAEVKIDSDDIAEGLLSYTSIGNGEGLVRFRKSNSWLLDADSFQFYADIEGCNAVNPETGQAIVCQYGRLVSYPLLTKEETYQYAKSILDLSQ